MATTFMNLNLPVVSTTLGPQWATELNAALDVVDQHDHSSGKGVKIKPAGLDINANLSFANNRATNVAALNLQSQVTPFSGASNSNLIHSVQGNLYFVNGAGVAIQITTGASLVPSPAVVNAFEFTTVAGNLIISPTDTFVVVRVDTTSPRTITLPSASAVVPGRMYIIKDLSGLSNDNPITITRQVGDTIEGAAADYTIDSNFGSYMVIGDGASNWVIV